MVILQVKGGRVEVLWKSVYKRGIFPMKTDKNAKTASLQATDIIGVIQAPWAVALLEGVVAQAGESPLRSEMW